MKKLLSIILFAVMLASMLAPVGVFATEKTEGSLGGDTYWKFDEATGELTVYGTGATDDFYERISYENGAKRTPRPGFFDHKDNIKSVVVEQGITVLGKSIFAQLVNLSEISLPNTLTEIGEGSFGDCTSLQKINLPDSLISIGNSAFYNCSSLKEINLPESLEIIENRAFSNCTSLTAVEWPPKVTKIGILVFENCSNLKEFTIPRTVTEIDASFLKGTGVKQIIVPNTVERMDSAFSESNCETIIFEEGSTYLPSLFCENYNLKNVVFPPSISEVNLSFFSVFGGPQKGECKLSFTGTQEEYDAFLVRIAFNSEYIANLFKESDVEINYVVEETTSVETTEVVVDTTATDTTVADTTKEENIADETPSENSVRDDEKNNSSEYNLEIILIVIGVVITSVAVIAIVVVKKKKDR